MERISELVDGELEAREAQRQLARLKQDQELARCWGTFQAPASLSRFRGYR